MHGTAPDTKRNRKYDQNKQKKKEHNHHLKKKKKRGGTEEPKKETTSGLYWKVSLVQAPKQNAGEGKPKREKG